MASTKVMVIILAVVRVTMSSVEVPKITLNDGNQIPSLALGTYGSDRDRARMRQAINWAVEAGYRHIDTASMYRNEVEIGQGIADVVNKGLVKREDLFVTTKLGHDKHAEQLVVPALRESLSRLGLDYVDLYLIHSPVSTTADGDPSHIDYLETWQGMEEAKSLGLAKSIGVSNFNTEQIDRLLAYSHFPPAVNQIEVPKIALNDGNQIPILALGTYGSANDRAKMRQAINWAVEAGYRHIDTASIYGNEVEIGQGIADVVNKSLVKREDLFVTTKLWDDKHAKDQVVPALRESLSRLGLDYVDLYLIHSPESATADGTPSNIDYLETWQGMEEAKRLGLAKSIGVSNFNIEQIDRLLVNSSIPPAVNQIEVHPSRTQTQLVAHNQEHQIVVMAYSPFGFLVSRNQTYSAPPRADDPALMKIAQKYGKTPGQVVLRYLIDRGTIPIPKSTDQNRQRENIDVFDFKLTYDEIETINNFNSNTNIL
ncbi:aldo-keto reductase AKR2E4-like isoform X2 [Hyposmocoma kahamanoa]|uniref:aldo-keto reductase AKR2E4-like isoform X2 n=1 Tax=Hyposmocoma kahamanoa TaxID=1477025 RepID=UPI000E6D9ADF|nr:aldo-keto reductase AKR2E4-like isoform X2 [Hyposmocoma kahamanoa]